MSIATNGGDGDFIDRLRTGIQGRPHGPHGRIGIAGRDRAAAIVEVQCETDFTAHSPLFAEAVERIAEIAINGPSGPVVESDEIRTALNHVRDSTGEFGRLVRGENLTGSRYATATARDAQSGLVIGYDGDSDIRVLGRLMAKALAGELDSLDVAAEFASMNVELEHMVRYEVGG